jgi:hypothetical protein
MAHFEPSKEDLVPLPVKRPHPGMGRFDWIRRPLFLTLLMVAGLIGTCWGQGTQGGITGRVSDSSGASIPGAAVHVANSATNVSSDVTTTETGDYSVHGLIPGVYQVTVTKAGFKTAVENSVTVSTATTSTLNITLGIGTSSETVTVTADLNLLVTESAEIGTVMPEQSVLDLPIQVGGTATIGASGRRQIETFAFLTPGVTGNQWSKNINGAPGFSQEILYDGEDAQNIGAPGFIAESSPPYEAVSEFKIQNTMYPVEYGFGFGVENYTFRSGTNQFHGDAFEFVRNQKLDASGYYGGKGPLHQNEFGGTFGGPVTVPHLYHGRDKTFFFASYDGFRLTGGNASAQYVTIPSLKERGGDFTDYPYPIYDPATTTLQPDGTYTRQQISYNGVLNTIDPARISEVAKRLIALLPAPARDGYSLNYLDHTKQPTNEDSGSMRVDHEINQNNHLHGTFWWVYGKTTVTGPLSGNVLDYTYRNTVTDAGGIRASYDRVFTPNLTNTVGFGYTPGSPTWSNWLIDPVDGNATLQIPGIPTSAPGWPQIAMSGYQTLGNAFNMGVPIKFNNWALHDTVNWSHQKQQVSFGFQWRHRNMHFTDVRNSAGNLIFNNYSTSNPADTANFGTYGNGFASLLLGQVDTGSVVTPEGWSTFGDTFAALFAQDVIKLTPKLTLTAGLRYEVPRYPMAGEGGNVSRLNLTKANPEAGNLPGALEFSGNASGAIGTFNFLYKNPRNDWTPRFAAAYQLNDKTVLRAGIGTFLLYQDYGRLNSGGTWGQGFGYTQTLASNNQDITPAFLLDSGFPTVNITLPDTNPSLQNGGSPAYVNKSGWKPSTQLSWTFDVERELLWGMNLDVAYVGARTTNLGAGFENADQVDPKYLTLASTLNADINSPAAVAAGIKAPYAGFTGSVAQALRPFPQFSGILDQFQVTGYSHYNALQARLQKRLSNNLSLLASYTFGKTNGLVPDATQTDAAAGSLNTYNINAEKGLADFDQAHVLVVSWTYSLPVGRGQAFASAVPGVVNQVIGGWQVNAVQRYNSGTPLKFGGGTSLPLFAGIGNRPNRVAGVPIKADISTSGSSWDPSVDRLFNPGAFSLPAPYTFGNAASIYPVRNPFTYNEDISVFKKFPVRESIYLEVRTEMFNAFNRVVFSGPNTTVGDPNFGIMQGTNTPRVIQLAGKIIF